MLGTIRCLLPLLLLLAVFSLASAAERIEQRLLFDFETPDELAQFQLEGCTMDLVQDNGVTHGTKCARVNFPKGADYGVFEFGGEKAQNWGNFDYFAFDVYQELDQKTGLNFELWDQASKNYATRCSYEENVIRQGKNTVLVRIDKSKRNGKSGLDWEELKPQDKIDMNHLKKVKFILTPPKDKDLVWWIDNLRLLQEDVISQKFKVQLPPGAQAFAFGQMAEKLVPGFTPVPKDLKYNAEKGCGFSANAGAAYCGKHWPDALTGDGVYAPAGETLSVELKLADGEYCVWLDAGMNLKNITNPDYLLTVGDQELCKDTPSPADFNGEKYLYRFMNTQYSERPNALWLDFIAKMYPAWQTKVKVTGGKLDIKFKNFWLSAVLCLPAAREAEFKTLCEAIQAERIRIFNSGLLLDKQVKPVPLKNEKFVCFVPEITTVFTPATAPSEAERARRNYDLAGAPGQSVVFRLGLTPFADLGTCKLALSALKGPAEIPPTAAKIYYQDYRVRGSSVCEVALKPASQINVEKGVSWCWWAWLRIPEAAKPGAYTGSLTLNLGGAQPVVLPVKLTVYPFKLEEILPYSFGMYYGPPELADAAKRKQLIQEQFQFMRQIGFTGAYVGSGVTVTGINGDNTVNVSQDNYLWQLAKEAGFGRHPMQFQMSTSLGNERIIARRFLGLPVDHNVGCEFKDPRLHPLFVDCARKQAAFIKQQGLPTAVEIVDEPREMPNPWNRNLEQTNTLGDWLREGGIEQTFVDPMGDMNAGRDYTSLVDHATIISTHAGAGSQKLMALTPQKNKTLWLYNTGMDRLSWGFYNWRVSSAGRWEWHWCSVEGSGEGPGYMNDEEWYNSFTGRWAYTSSAPHPANPGGFLFQSLFLTCCDGITDTAYLVTLDKALAAAQARPEKAALAAKVKEFLAKLKNDIPFLPGVKGIASADEGALVGKGLESAASAQCENWRRQIAEFLTQLQ